MCGRYQFSHTAGDPAMQRLLTLAGSGATLLPDGEVTPGMALPVLIDGPERAQVRMMQWGFPLGETGRRIINARAETAGEKRMFAHCWRKTRCVIPTTGFYEWDDERKKYYFNGEDGKMLYLAGLYDNIQGNLCFVVLTCPSVGQVAAIHQRQPVVLAQREILAWLRDLREASRMLLRAGAFLQGTLVEGETNG